MYPSCVIFAFLLHFSNSDSTSKGVRLVGGKNQMEGRVEIYFNGQWGTICDNHRDWSVQGDKEATVLCRQLDLGLFGLTESGAMFGEGTGNIWNGKLSCNGSEKSIQDCYTPINDGGEWIPCDHSEDFGVVCTSEMRLNGKNGSREGHLEVYFQRTGEWKFITDTSLLDQEVVTAVCRELGLGMEGTLVSVNGSSDDVGSGMEVELDEESLQGFIFNTHRDLPVISCSGVINKCLTENPCSPNGACIHDLENNTLSCFCHSGFKGLRCEEAVSRGMNINPIVLKVMIPLVFLFVALVLVCVVVHHRKRKRNGMSLVLDNSTPATTTIGEKKEYVSLSEK